MSATLVTIIHPAFAPPGDLTAGLDPPEVWWRFTTGEANGYVAWWPEKDSFLLHWIESHRKGDGTRVLEAIGRWADEHGLDGKLICTVDTVPFYSRLGWLNIGQYMDPGHVEMWRPVS